MRFRLAARRLIIAPRFSCASGLDVMLPTNPWLRDPARRLRGAHGAAAGRAGRAARGTARGGRARSFAGSRSPCSGCAGGNGLDRLPAALRVVGAST